MTTVLMQSTFSVLMPVQIHWGQFLMGARPPPGSLETIPAFEPNRVEIQISGPKMPRRTGDAIQQMSINCEGRDQLCLVPFVNNLFITSPSKLYFFRFWLKLCARIDCAVPVTNLNVLFYQPLASGAYSVGDWLSGCLSVCLSVCLCRQTFSNRHFYSFCPILTKLGTHDLCANTEKNSEFFSLNFDL